MSRSRSHRLFAALAVCLALLALVWLALDRGDATVPDLLSTTVEARQRVPEPVVGDLAGAGVEVARTSVEESAAVTAPAEDVAVEDVELETGPITQLRVSRAGTVQHATDVELRVIARYYSHARELLPGRGRPFVQLEGRYDSPITLRAEVTTSEPQLLAALRVDAPNIEKRCALSKPPGIRRGVAVYARAPGTAWGRVELDLLEPATRDIELPSGRQIRLSFTNWQAAGYRQLGLQPWLRVLLDGRSSRQPLDERSLGSGILPPAVSLEGVPSGVGIGVRVTLGNQHDDETPFVLADTRVVPDPMSDEPVVVVLSDPPEPAPIATLTGRLVLAEFPGREGAELRLFGPDSTYSEPTATVSLADMEPEAGARDTWRFGVELPTGDYQAKLWPLLTSWVFEVPAGGTHADLVVDRIARVRVAVLHRATGRPVEIERLFWRRQYGMAGIRHYGGEDIRPPGPSSSFVFHTSPGSIAFDVDQDDPRLVGVDEVEVGAGSQRVDLVVDAPTGAMFRFRLGDSLLPLAAPGLPGVFLRAVDGEGEQTIDRTAVDGCIDVSGPGRYRVSLSFGEDSPYRYTGEELHVDVVQGRREEVEIELVRR